MTPSGIGELTRAGHGLECSYRWQNCLPLGYSLADSVLDVNQITAGRRGVPMCSDIGYVLLTLSMVQVLGVPRVPRSGLTGVEQQGRRVGLDTAGILA